MTPLAVQALLACLVLQPGVSAARGTPDSDKAAPPVVEGRWVRPAAAESALPVWGHAEGLWAGLWPMPGPRGLIRIYAPYLGHAAGRPINFIAVEPIPAGRRQRGFSELEYSDLDQTRGKRFWSADDPGDPSPKLPRRPARGVIFQEGGVEALRVFVFVEPFANGARVYLRLSFRSDRPYELGIATFVCEDSQPLGHCIVTATMGNYARLRTLHLADRRVLSTDLWPEHRGFGFAPHKQFPLAGLFRTRQEDVLVAATPNEPSPQDAEYAPFTPKGWRYCGRPATQYWRCEKPHPRLAVQVNGRSVYWGSLSPIPGGVSYENFEIVEPFRDGAEFHFGVTPQRPDQPGFGLPSVQAASN